MTWSLTRVMESVFWISAGLILYTYLVYPFLLAMLAGLYQAWTDLQFAARRKNRRRRPPAEHWSSVSLVIAACNEEAVIAEKMRNCGELDYPSEKLEILVGCDGCTDATAELARAANLGNAVIHEYRERSGKSPVVDRLVKEARGEIVVFSDANTMLDKYSLRSLVRHFADPQVGCVCGELRLLSPEGGPRTESLYWRYETALRFLESRLNLNLGANGAIYAIRRELFSPLEKQPADDFLLPMRIRDAGYRQIYDPEAIAYEEALASVQHEFRRRIRNLSGTLPALMATLHMLSPTAGRVAFSYWSHKVLRWVAPFAMVLAFLAAAVLSPNSPFYLGCVVMGFGMALLAFVGYRLESRQVHRSIFSIPYYFLSMNLALILAFVRFLRGGHRVAWDRGIREKKLA